MPSDSFLSSVKFNIAVFVATISDKDVVGNDVIGNDVVVDDVAFGGIVVGNDVIGISVVGNVVKGNDTVADVFVCNDIVVGNDVTDNDVEGGIVDDDFVGNDVIGIDVVVDIVVGGIVVGNDVIGNDVVVDDVVLVFESVVVTGGINSFSTEDGIDFVIFIDDIAFVEFVLSSGNVSLLGVFGINVAVVLEFVVVGTWINFLSSEDGIVFDILFPNNCILSDGVSGIVIVDGNVVVAKDGVVVAAVMFWTFSVSPSNISEAWSS